MQKNTDLYFKENSLYYNETKIMEIDTITGSSQYQQNNTNVMRYDQLWFHGLLYNYSIITDGNYIQYDTNDNDIDYYIYYTKKDNDIIMINDKAIIHNNKIITIMNKNKTTANLSQKYLYINNNESIICYDKSTHEIMNNNKNSNIFIEVLINDEMNYITSLYPLKIQTKSGIHINYDTPMFLKRMNSFIHSIIYNEEIWCLCSEIFMSKYNEYRQIYRFVVFDMNLKFNRYSESFRLINVSEEYYNCNCFSITDNKIEYIIRLNNKNIVAYSEIDCCKWWYD